MRKFILAHVKHLLKKDVIITPNPSGKKHPTKNGTFQRYLAAER